MKTLYEKYCFLNGLLEEKLDEPNFQKVLRTYGFEIQVRNDSLAENYTRIKFTEQGEKGEVTVKPKKEKNSFQ